MTFDKLRKKAYEPYIKEFEHDAFIQFLILSVGGIVMACFNVPGIITRIYLPVCIICVLILCLTNFRTYIFIMSERITSKYRTKTLVIKELKHERWWTDQKYTDKSVMSRIYDNQIQMERYKVLFVDENNKKQVLRAAMSYKKRDKLNDIILKHGDCRISVTYGAFSKVIINFNKNEQFSEIYDLNYMR